MSLLEPWVFPEYSFSVLPLANIKAQVYSHKPPERVQASFGPLTDGEEEDKRSGRPLPSVWFNWHRTDLRKCSILREAHINLTLCYCAERKERLFFHENLKFMIKQVNKGQISTLKR